MQLNGLELRITPGSFHDAKALEKAMERAIKGSQIDLNGVKSDIMKKKADGSLDIASIDLSGAGPIVTTILNLVLGAACSDEVEACLFACSKTALLGTEKIDAEFFENVDHRELYYPIMVEIIKVNVGPFFKGLASLKSEALGVLAGSSPK
jgi:hypothetical protein